MPVSFIVSLLIPLALHADDYWPFLSDKLQTEETYEVLAGTQTDFPEFGWRSNFFGPGIQGHVYALLEYQGELIVTGSNLSADELLGPDILRWNGSTWLPFTVDGEVSNFNGIIRELAIYRGDLIVAGDFTRIGEQDFFHIARWDGDRWRPLGDEHSNGVGDSAYDSVTTIEVHGGDLYVGGLFNVASGNKVFHIARWNGSEWFALGSVTKTEVESGSRGWPVVHDMVSYGDELIVVGRSGFAGNGNPQIVARWTQGDWLEVPGADQILSFERLGSVAVYDQKVFIAGDTLDSRTFVWDGDLLEAVTSGTCTWINECDYEFLELIVFAGDLYGIGRLEGSGLGGLNRRSAVARWHDNGWKIVHVSDPIFSEVADVLGRSAAVFDNQLVVGGSIPWHRDNVRLNNIAAYDGVGWNSIPASGGNGIPAGTILDAAHWDESLVVAGTFQWVGGKRAYGIARWDGFSWQLLEGAAEIEMVSVKSLEKIGDDLYALGRIVDEDGEYVTRLAQYNSFGASIVATPEDHIHEIEEIEVWNDKLIAAFLRSGTSTSSVRAFDGQEWASIESGGPGEFSGSIYDFEIHNDELYAAGDFSSIDGFPVNRIARLDGSSWQSLLPDLPELSNGFINEMLSYEGSLWIGGAFSHTFHSDDHYFAYWDGISWSLIETPRVVDWRGIERLNLWEDQIVATGAFRDSNDVYRPMARYTGETWAYFEGPVIGSWMPSAKKIVDWQDKELFLGGFSIAGGVPAWGIAEFVPEPASVEIVSMSFLPWPPWPFDSNTAFVHVTARGLVTEPETGAVTVVSDQDESCSDSRGEQSGDMARKFSCFIEFEGGGPRELTAVFSASDTHGDAEFDGFETAARWPTSVTLETIPGSEQTIGQPFEVVVDVKSAGIPTGEIIVEAEHYYNNCIITLPDDRCTLVHFETEEIELSAFYRGDRLNQPSSKRMDFNIIRGDLTFSPQPVDFGKLAIGQTSSARVVSVRNVSDNPLIINSIGSPELPFFELPFGTCRPLPLTLQSGENCTLHYRFTPVTNENRSSLIIRSTASDSPHLIYLNGEGVDAIFWDAFE